MNELALFAGAGGGILGGKLLGWTTVGAVEIEEYPRKVLLQRQRDGILRPFPIWDDVSTFDGRPWRGIVDVVTGGSHSRELLKNAAPNEARKMLGGSLNPDWVEWLMGWPIKWTDLEPLEMVKFRSWRRSHLTNLNAD